MVTLNVGGQIFLTTRDTLLKGETMLSKLFSGKYKITQDKEGNPFLDRDGTHFRLILNYLRSGKIVLPQDLSLLAEIQIEADYYQIKELSQHIERIIQREKRVGLAN
jgi:hypothetical protein